MTGLYLVDDRIAGSWRPFTLTRPAGELLFGDRTLRGRSEAVTGLSCEGYVASPLLQDFSEDEAPAVGVLDLSASERPRLYLWSRLVLSSLPSMPEDRGAILEADGTLAGLWLPEGVEGPASFDDPAATGFPVIALDGYLLDTVWELMGRNGDQLRLDGSRYSPSTLPTSVHRIGDGLVSLGEGVHLEPGVVIDTRGGPVIIDRDVKVHAFTRIAGPAYVGPGSILLGGAFESVSFGPMCRIRGEVRATVVLGYSNKAHDGFLGHSILGRWVNLGAMTTNSNLKNNYGSIRIVMGDATHDTGMNKVGCFLGDHVKTGIGTMLNTGTVIEAASNVFGGVMPPKYVPPFSWGAGADLTEHDPERFLQTAETAMGRRGVTLDEATRRLYLRAHSVTADLRSSAS